MVGVTVTVRVIVACGVTTVVGLVVITGVMIVVGLIVSLTVAIGGMVTTVVTSLGLQLLTQEHTVLMIVLTRDNRLDNAFCDALLLVVLDVFNVVAGVLDFDETIDVRLEDVEVVTSRFLLILSTVRPATAQR